MTIRQSFNRENLLRGKLTLFQEQGMEYYGWAFEQTPDVSFQDPYERLHMVSPGDSLVVFEKDVPDLSRLDRWAFDEFVNEGEFALVEPEYTDQFLFSMSDVKLDFEANKEDLVNDNEWVKRMQEYGVPIPKAYFVQRMDNYIVHGIPAEPHIRDFWIDAFKGEYPAMLVKNRWPKMG